MPPTKYFNDDNIFVPAGYVNPTDVYKYFKLFNLKIKILQLYKLDLHLDPLEKDQQIGQFTNTWLPFESTIKISKFE